ncbi:MAG: sigma-54-dependent transcriptional regulator, partial [Candidatus Binatia bacterium]
MSHPSDPHPEPLRPRVLLAEDDALLRRGLTLALGAAGLNVTGVAHAPEALEAVARERFDAVITDLMLDDRSGLEIVRAVRRSTPETPVLIMTGNASSESASEALREGALDYLVKPVAFRELVERVKRAIEWRRLALGGAKPQARGDVTGAGGPREAESRVPTLTGDSEAFRGAVALAERYAVSALTVLITGETGVGKDVLARYIHARSARRDGPFVACNLTAIPETLVESELFGHVRGAFTGADRVKKGLVEVAEGGTLFL